MNPKLHRHLGGVAFFAVMIVSLQLWNWAADHLTMWEAALVLVGILGGQWAVARFLRRRREASKAREGEARRGE